MVKKVFLLVLICTIIINLYSIAAVAIAPDETNDTEMELSDINTSELIYFHNRSIELPPTQNSFHS